MAASIMGRSVHTLFFQLLGQFSTIVTGIALARMFGPAGKGYVGYAALSLGMITVFFNGQSEAIAYQLGRRGLPIQKVALATLKLLLCLVPLLIVALLVIAKCWPSQEVLVFSAIALPFALVAQMCVPYLLVLDMVKRANYQALLINISYGVLVIPAVIFFHAGVGQVLGLWVFSNIIGMCFGLSQMLPLLRKKSLVEPAEEPIGLLPSDDRALNEATLAAVEASTVVMKSPGPTDGHVAREQAVFMFKSGLAAMGGYLNLRIDAYFVSWMLGAKEYGIYGIAIATGELMWKISSAVIWSSLGRIANSPQPEAARLVAKITRHIFTAQMGAGIVAFIIGPTMITLVYGKQFSQAGDALRVILPGLVAYTMEGAIGYFITVQLGKPLLRLSIQITSVVICSAVSVLTIGKLSIVGAALATSISYLSVIAIVSTIFLRHTKLPLRDLFILSPQEAVRLRNYAIDRFTAPFKRKTKPQEVPTRP